MLILFQPAAALPLKTPDHFLRHMGPPLGQPEGVLDHLKIPVDHNDPAVKDIRYGIQLHIHGQIPAVLIHIGHPAHLVADDQTLVLHFHNSEINLGLAKRLVRHLAQNVHGKKTDHQKQETQRHLHADGPFPPNPFYPT